ncbi:hypothetical protein AAMO2058_000458200 [Amorphochlora amoebiformis]
MEIENPRIGLLTDFEVLEFLKEGSMRKYPRLDAHIKEHNSLLKQISKEIKKPNNKAYLDKAKLEDIKRISQVVWTFDTVRTHLEGMPAGTQKPDQIERLFKTIKTWRDEFEIEPESLSSEGFVLDGLNIIGTHGNAKDIGVRQGKIVSVDGKEVNNLKELQVIVDKAVSDKKQYKITVESGLSKMELVNILNSIPTTPAELRPLISDLDERMTVERENELIAQIWACVMDQLDQQQEEIKDSKKP